MENSDDEKEVRDLSEIYAVLRSDAKQIVADLQGGVIMWREAAAGALTTTLFIVILILTAIHYNMFGGGTQLQAYIAGTGVIALVMGGFSVIGFRKYFLLRKRYHGLFIRAKALE
ncbi:MAG TPA: hypothetical protein VLU91_05340 [Nitrososphaerales archaeon]|nr:hypothetical protein [Nitrososphaerales archaeon]